EVHGKDGMLREERENPSGAHDSPDYRAGLLAKYEALLGQKGAALKSLVLEGDAATPVADLLASMR
ncbi:MAG TPA: hypothetical protein VJ947_07540, partial [Pseudohaliea sp.]|nr:hypothetical protein [Pseudohaliea sp.]